MGRGKKFQAYKITSSTLLSIILGAKLGVLSYLCVHLMELNREVGEIHEKVNVVVENRLEIKELQKDVVKLKVKMAKYGK